MTPCLRLSLLATQNPIEHEGTYRLPEAELDRFFIKILVGYPSVEEELKITISGQEDEGSFDAKSAKMQAQAFSSEDLSALKDAARSIHCDEAIVLFRLLPLQDRQLSLACPYWLAGKKGALAQGA